MFDSSQECPKCYRTGFNFTGNCAASMGRRGRIVKTQLECKNPSCGHRLYSSKTDLIKKHEERFGPIPEQLELEIQLTA